MVVKLLFFLILVCAVGKYCSIHAQSFEDNEFAEFEVADDSFIASSDNVDSIFEEAKKVESENKEAEKQKEFQSDEDFNFNDEFDSVIENKIEPNEKVNPDKTLEIKPLTFADVPAHFRSNWSNYQVEALTLIIIFIYVVNYVYGKTKNSSIAYNWFLKNRNLLEHQFSLVGDDGISEEPTGGHLIKETDSSYVIWCSGRANCRGMLTQLKLKKRQDLLSYAISLFRPKLDRVVHKIELSPGEMDSFVMIFGQKKSVLNAVKEYTDLSVFTVERRNTDRFGGLPQNFTVFAEIAETISSLIDPQTLQFIKKFEKYIEFFHFSDQYSGIRHQDDNTTATRLPETTPTLFFSYYLFPDESEDVTEEVIKTLNNFTFFMLDRVCRYRLSKEGKNKADKKRQSVEEQFLKVTHLQRQEAAQARREEKTRERKSRVLEEEDPEKQRRLEKLEQKREQKLRQPRMKQIRIK